MLDDVLQNNGMLISSSNSYITRLTECCDTFSCKETLETLLPAATVKKYLRCFSSMILSYYMQGASMITDYKYAYSPIPIRNNIVIVKKSHINLFSFTHACEVESVLRLFSVHFVIIPFSSQISRSQRNQFVITRCTKQRNIHYDYLLYVYRAYRIFGSQYRRTYGIFYEQTLQTTYCNGDTP